MRTVLLLVAFALLAQPAMAGDFLVLVKTPGGAPIPDAVVTLTPPGGAHGPIKFDWPMKMAQRNISFEPFVLIAPVGADVAFPNFDKVRHHVYSFSPTKTFELKLYSHDETRSVHFDKPGVVALGCNIHDRMVGFIKVVDTPYAAKTDASGQAVLSEVPVGGATLRVWQPYLKAPGNEIAMSVSQPAQGSGRQTIVVDVRPAPAPMAMR